MGGDSEFRTLLVPMAVVYAVQLAVHHLAGALPRRPGRHRRPHPARRRSRRGPVAPIVERHRLTLLIVQIASVQVLGVGVRILAALIAVPERGRARPHGGDERSRQRDGLHGQQAMVAALDRRSVDGELLRADDRGLRRSADRPAGRHGRTPLGRGRRLAERMLPFVVAGALALPVALASSWTDPRRARDSGRPSSRRLPAHRLVRLPQMWRSSSTSAIVLVTVDLPYTMLPLWAAHRDVDAGVLGALLTLRAAVSVLSRTALSRVVDRVGVRSVLSTALTSGVVALPMLAVAPTRTAWVAMTLLGVALGAPQPLTMAWIVGLVPAAAQGAALGLRQWTNRAGQVVLPSRRVRCSRPPASPCSTPGCSLTPCTWSAPRTSPAAPAGRVRVAMVLRRRRRTRPQLPRGASATLARESHTRTC